MNNKRLISKRILQRILRNQPLDLFLLYKNLVYPHCYLRFLGYFLIELGAKFVAFPKNNLL